MSTTYNKQAYWLFLLFFSFEILRPQDSFAPFLAPLKLPSILALLVALYSLFLAEKKDIYIKPIKYYLLFTAYLFLSVIYAEHSVVSLYIAKDFVIWFLVFFVPMATLVNTKEKLFNFCTIFILLNSMVAVWGLTHGGRGPGSFTLDENDLALFMCMTLPISVYLSLCNKVSPTVKWLSRISALLITMCIVSTFSRGGFLGLVTVIMMIWWLSKNRIKWLLIGGFLALILGPIVVGKLPEGYVEDMYTISDTENSTRNERLHSWGLGWEMFKDNPILGVGVANYPRTVGEYEAQQEGEARKSVAWRQAHSLYFTLIPELGIIGVILYGFLIWFAFSRMASLFRNNLLIEKEPDLVLMAKALFVSFSAFFIAAIFLSVLYEPVFFIMLALSISIWFIAEKLKKESTPELNVTEANVKGRKPVEI